MRHSGWVTRAARIGIGFAALTLLAGAHAGAQYMDRQVTHFMLADQLEYRSSSTGRPVQWDLSGWIGNSYSRVWVKSEGDWSTMARDRDFDIRAEYSRLIAPFWELQGGVRLETRQRANRTDTRAHLDVGLLGLAPYWFELEPELFIAQDGQVSARLTAEYDVFITQRLIAQPRFETYGAASENWAFGVGSGLNYVEPGLRFRYEFRRELAPYVGVEWYRKLGSTADRARDDGERIGDLALVAGMRAWW